MLQQAGLIIGTAGIVLAEAVNKPEASKRAKSTAAAFGKDNKSWLVRVGLEHRSSEAMDRLESEFKSIFSQKALRGSTGVLKKSFKRFGMMHFDDVSADMVEELRNHPAIAKVYRNMPVWSTATRSTNTFSSDGINFWNLDFADATQNDDVYTYVQTGVGVTVYVMDTGLNEDATTDIGTNIQNFYTADGIDTPSDSDNTDGNGHGTHVAGTIGGQNSGISTTISVLMSKVLGDDGSGSTAGIIDALANVYNTHNVATDGPAVISMSLGGSCSDLLCYNDATNDVIDDYLSPAGFIVVAAAGNDYCDSACYSTPSGAGTAITVGALAQSGSSMSFAEYSTDGDCLDVNAPGSDIWSACYDDSSADCTIVSSGTSFQSMSGTSMATPMVAGIIGQWLELDDTMTDYTEIRKALQCDGVANAADMTFAAGNTKDISAKTPDGSSAATVSGCTRGSGCTSSCSDHGWCDSGTCYCDKGYIGDACEYTKGPDGNYCGSSAFWYGIGKYDEYSDGWDSGYYTLYDSAGNGLYTDTMECTGTDGDEFCLEPDTYTISLTVDGAYPEEIYVYVPQCDDSQLYSLDEGDVTFTINADGSCGDVEGNAGVMMNVALGFVVTMIMALLH